MTKRGAAQAKLSIPPSAPANKKLAAVPRASRSKATEIEFQDENTDGIIGINDSDSEDDEERLASPAMGTKLQPKLTEKAGRQKMKPKTSTLRQKAPLKKSAVPTMPTTTTPQMSRYSSPLPSVADFQTPRKQVPSIVIQSPSRPRGTPKKNKRPKPSELVVALGNTQGAAFLIDAVDEDEYRRRASFFHARLALLIRGLNNNELTQIFNAAMLGFIGRLDEIERDALRADFDNAYTLVEHHLLQSVTEMAKTWLASDAGKAYRVALIASNRAHSAVKPKPYPDCVDHIYEFLGQKGTELTEEHMIMTWGLSLAACKSEQQPTARLHHWFSEDSARTLYTSLYDITGSLVVRAAQVLVGNVDWLQDAQTGELRTRLRLTDPTLPFSNAFKRCIPTFRDTSQSLKQVVRSLPNHELGRPHPPSRPISPSYITAPEAHNVELRTKELFSNKETELKRRQQENLDELNEDIAQRNQKLPVYFQNPANLPTLEPMVVNGAVLELFAVDYARSPWPRRTELHLAGLYAEHERYDACLTYICKEMDAVEYAIKRVEAAEADRQRYRDSVIEAREKLAAAQSRLEDAKEKTTNVRLLDQTPTHPQSFNRQARIGSQHDLLRESPGSSYQRRLDTSYHQHSGLNFYSDAAPSPLPARRSWGFQSGRKYEKQDNPALSALPRRRTTNVCFQQIGDRQSPDNSTSSILPRYQTLQDDSEIKRTRPLYLDAGNLQPTEDQNNSTLSVLPGYCAARSFQSGVDHEQDIAPSPTCRPSGYQPGGTHLNLRTGKDQGHQGIIAQDGLLPSAASACRPAGGLQSGVDYHNLNTAPPVITRHHTEFRLSGKLIEKDKVLSSMPARHNIKGSLQIGRDQEDQGNTFSPALPRHRSGNSHIGTLKNDDWYDGYSVAPGYEGKGIAQDIVQKSDASGTSRIVQDNMSTPSTPSNRAELEEQSEKTQEEQRLFPYGPDKSEDEQSDVEDGQLNKNDNAEDEDGNKDIDMGMDPDEQAAMGL